MGMLITLIGAIVFTALLIRGIIGFYKDVK